MSHFWSKFGPTAEIAVRRRFWMKVEKTAGCWLWKGALKKPEGYGFFKWRGKLHYAHRIAWEFKRGQIPDEFIVCHRCDTPGCVRPRHLFLGTPRDNMHDRDRKKRNGSYTKPGYARRGEQHPRAKLTANDVVVIRQLHTDGRTLASLAREFGVGEATVRQIVHRQIWKHVA